MPKITDEPLEAIQVRLFKKDLDYLRKFYGNTIGVNKAIRNVVRSLVKHNEALANSAIDQAEADNSLEKETEESAADLL